MEEDQRFSRTGDFVGELHASNFTPPPRGWQRLGMNEPGLGYREESEREEQVGEQASQEQNRNVLGVMRGDQGDRDCDSADPNWDTPSHFMPHAVVTQE